MFMASRNAVVFEYPIAARQSQSVFLQVEVLVNGRDPRVTDPCHVAAEAFHFIVAGYDLTETNGFAEAAFDFPVRSRVQR